MPDGYNAPSLYNVKCPHCNSGNFTPLGKKGALGKSIAVGGMFGAVGSLVASSNSKDDFTYEALQYKCVSCKKKFEALPFVAQPDEMLSAPCVVLFTRLSSFVGMAVSQSVWLNGLKVASIQNGKTIELMTVLKYNAVFVTDQYNVAFRSIHRFEASPGGRVEVKFKRKFVV